MIPKYRIWLRKYQNWIYTTLWFVPHKVFENKTQNDLSHHKKKNCLLVIYYLFLLSKSELHLLVGRLQCGSNHCKKSSAEILNIFWPTTYQICSDKEKNRLEQCTLLVIYLGFFSKKKIATYFGWSISAIISTGKYAVLWTGASEQVKQVLHRKSENQRLNKLIFWEKAQKN